LPPLLQRNVELVENAVHFLRLLREQFLDPGVPGPLVAVPPLPGATNTFCTRGLCASFHASACSRPPAPMTSSFINA